MSHIACGDDMCLSKSWAVNKCAVGCRNVLRIMSEALHDNGRLVCLQFWRKRNGNWWWY